MDSDYKKGWSEPEMYADCEWVFDTTSRKFEALSGRLLAAGFDKEADLAVAKTMLLKIVAK
tara:strand:- start:193 stop:375 length:183 start_codon:yes stop_codon:yes gene_type:complete